MKKRVLSILLVLVMLLGMFPMNAMAAEGEDPEAVTLTGATYNGETPANVQLLENATQQLLTARAAQPKAGM